jgi:hypothetical protein
MFPCTLFRQTGPTYRQWAAVGLLPEMPERQKLAPAIAQVSSVGREIKTATHMMPT